MREILQDYKYSRQYILVEEENNKFQKTLNSNQDLIAIDDFLWKIVTSVSQKNVDHRQFHMIQYDDKQIGWIELKDSIQIFRHPAEHYKIIEDEFTINEINGKLGIDKDFISHFKDKLLNVKSEVTYDDERYLSVFIKGKFHGFHHESVLDPIVNCDIDLSDYKNEFQLYKVSNLIKPVEDVEVEEMKLISLFKKNKIGKVLVDNEAFYWISLENADSAVIDKIQKVNTDTRKPSERLELDDLLYSINLERGKTKDILKSVLSAKNFLKNNKKEASLIVEENDTYKELKEKYEADTNEYEEKIRRLSNELELADSRLEHQRDYNNRLTEQRDRYKNRTTLVEEKLKTLNDKYKSLKDKYDKVRKNNSNLTKIKSAFKGDEK